MSARTFSMLASAAAVAAAVSLFIVPKLDAKDEANVDAAAETVNAAVTVEEAEGRLSAVLLVRNDGHYWARALVNRKASVDFMIDTGASTVAITQADARKMGLKPDRLDYDAQIHTAGGVTYGARVVIDSIRIGQVEVKDVRGMVLKDELGQSLLGMSFLRELYAYEFRGDRLIIRK